MIEKFPTNLKMLALLVYEYLKSHVAELNAPDYIHANHTQKVLYRLAGYLGLKPEFEYNHFDLAFLNDNGEVVMLMEDEDNSLNFRREELPKLVEAKAMLKVGVTYDSKLKERKEIVELTGQTLKQKKSEGAFLLILGYLQDTKREEPFVRFDGFLFDSNGALVLKGKDTQNRRINMWTE